MKKGKRVYIEDLVEEYPMEKAPIYAIFHKDILMNGPFKVIAAGKRRITVVNLDGGRSNHFCGDSGLTPWPGGSWNSTNATFEMIKELVWADDWM